MLPLNFCTLFFFFSPNGHILFTFFFQQKQKKERKKTWTIIAMHNACSYSVFHIPYYILIKPQRKKIVHRTVWTEPVKGVIVAVSICLLKWLAPFHRVKQTMNERQFACSLALLPSHCPWLETNSNSWHRSPYGVNAIFITTALLHLRDEKLWVFFFSFSFRNSLWRPIGMLLLVKIHIHIVFAWKQCSNVCSTQIVWNSFEFLKWVVLICSYSNVTSIVYSLQTCMESRSECFSIYVQNLNWLGVQNNCIFDSLSKFCIKICFFFSVMTFSLKDNLFSNAF